MDKSAGIFLLAAFAAAALLVVFAMNKNRERYTQLMEFCRLQGWNFDASKPTQLIPFLITGKTISDWALEAHIAGSSGQTGSRESGSSYHWKISNAGPRKGAVIIAVRIPVYATLIADTITPESLKGNLREINTGNDKLITLVSEGSGEFADKALVDALQKFMDKLDPGFLAIRVDDDGILLKVPFTVKGAQVKNIVEFGESVAALLK
jgi:hypothetical protein